MKYTFFDVETANAEPTSICAIGVVLVENNKIINKEYFLVKPAPFYMDSFNTSIHGITEDMVVCEPTFDIIWDKIKHYFNDATLFAHYSPFDMKCLRETLNYYHIEYPNAWCSCTYAISRKGVKGLPNHKLSTLASHYNIEFVHHNALEDAEASFLILSNVIKDNGVDNFEQIHDLLNIKKGYIKANGEWCGCYSESYRNDSIAKNIKAETDIFDESHPFYKKQIVFTGTLERMERKEAMQRIANIGGIPSDTITNTTNYLVVGKSDYINFELGRKTSKMLKAEKLISDGLDLEIIDENEFYVMMN